MVEQHIIDEIIRMHVDNGWESGIITKLIRRKFDIEIKSMVVLWTIDKYDMQNVQQKPLR